LDKRVYLNYFQNEDEYRLAIAINKPVKKVRWTVNLIDTKKHFWKIQNRTQIRTEFLKDPDYTVYFWHKNGVIYESLLESLRKHHSVYSVSLGLSELLANFQFLEETEVEEQNTLEPIEVHSVIPLDNIQPNSLQFETGKEILDVNYPLHMLPDREVDRRGHLLLERNGKSIRCRPLVYWQTQKGENIAFL